MDHTHTTQAWEEPDLGTEIERLEAIIKAQGKMLLGVIESHGVLIMVQAKKIDELESRVKDLERGSDEI